jgi:anthranilate synthase component 2
MVLVIDNYDSFTYNLVQYLGELGADLHVVRNDAVTVTEVDRLPVERIVISPGPGRPEQAGITVDLIRAYGSRVPILGVCLGHQAIGIAFGGAVVAAPALLHGKTSTVEHDGRGLFDGLTEPFPAGRYHSLAVDRTTVPDDLEVAATFADRSQFGAGTVLDRAVFVQCILNLRIDFGIQPNAPC